MDHNMAAIAELRERVEGHAEAIEKLDSRVTRHDEIIANLREAVAKVATKDDILKLSQNIDDKYSSQLRDAHNSIPAKFGLILTGGSVLIALITLVVSFARHG
jgi:hypothetical protein